MVNQTVAFSALRAYALSNRSTWLGAIVIILVLPPSVMTVVSISHIALVSVVGELLAAD